MKQYFTIEFLNFYKELAANNHKDWFDLNRGRYEREVKKPMQLFVSDLMAELSKDDKRMLLPLSDAIFRINRDIRFSKDKTPYKLFSSAAINPGGKKDMAHAGIYVELGPEKLGIAGGIYMPDKDTINRIREAIVRTPKKFTDALNNREFKKVWGELLGERNKMLPASWKSIAAEIPQLYNKQFYYWTELDSDIIVSKKLLPTILKHYEAALPLKHFFDAAVDK